MLKLFIRGFIVLFFIVVAWQGAVTLNHTPNYLLPAPSDILRAFTMHTDLLFRESLPTILETLAGLLIGTLLAFYIAIIILLIKPAEPWLLPLIIASQAIPTFAIAPLLVFWLGYGISSKIIITTLMIFFPITSSFYDGLKRTPHRYLVYAKAVNAPRIKTLWYIQVPTALPSLASGLRVGATFAPMGAVIGEWVGSSQGLGYLILTSNAHLETSVMFAALVILVIFTLLLYFIVDKLSKVFIPWSNA